MAGFPDYPITCSDPKGLKIVIPHKVMLTALIMQSQLWDPCIFIFISNVISVEDLERPDGTVKTLQYGR